MWWGIVAIYGALLVALMACAVVSAGSEVNAAVRGIRGSTDADV